MSEPIAGKRIEIKDGWLPTVPGQYGKDERTGIWWAKPPKPGFPTGMLSDHDVTEHPDGTITVSPSILVEGDHGKTWHGYLERGIWREV